MSNIAKKRHNPSSVPCPATTIGLELAGAVTLEEWRKAADISRTTAWYWRQSGKLKVVYRYGRAYVSAEESRRVLADVMKNPHA